MQWSRLFLLGLFACSKPVAQPAALHIDLSAMWQAADTSQIVVSKVGLLAIHGTQMDPAQAQQAVLSQQGAASSTTTVDPTAGDTSKSGKGDTPVTGAGNGPTSGGSPVVLPIGHGNNPGTNTARDTTTTTGAATVTTTNSGDPTASPTAATANPVIGSIANGSGSGTGAALAFGYYPVNMAPGASTFSLAVPAGDDQTLVLIAFVTDPTSGVDRPVYIGELEHVDLKATETNALAFTIHPAGLVRPEILPPSSLGLSDAKGNAVASVPQLNCLSVATADHDRDGFPSVTAERLMVGALANLTDVQKATGAMILPVGHWSINCYANFADHLFALPPGEVIGVDVVQGQVYAPSVPLVATQIIATGGSTGGSGVGGSSSGGAITTPIKPPRVNIALHQHSAGLDRELAGTSGTQTGGPVTINEGPIEANLNSTEVDPDLTLELVTEDNAAVAFDGVVRVTISSLDATFPIGWSPFSQHPSAIAPHGTDVAVKDGQASVASLLEVSTLDPGLNTLHFVLTASVIDALGNVLQPTGAFVLTVRKNGACQLGTVAPIESLSIATLTIEPNVVVATLDNKGTYATPATSVVAAAWGGAANCLVATSDDTLLALSANPDNVLLIPQQIDLAATPFGQWVLYDTLSLDPDILARTTPKAGTTQPVAISYEGVISGTWNVTTRIDLAP